MKKHFSVVTAVIIALGSLVGAQVTIGIYLIWQMRQPPILTTLHVVNGAAVLAAPPAQISDEMIENIVQRVMARMSDDSVRRTIIETAERLVREEIERIKRSAHSGR